MSVNNDPVLQACLSCKDRLLDNLRHYVSCQSVSTDPAYEAGMENARQWLEHYLADSGFEQVRRLDAEGHPALFAQWLNAPGKPTLLVYGHYDVQPPDPLDQWQTEPFKMTVRDDRLYARGISDDKGPTMIALDVLAAYLRVEQALPVNIKILLEGEEETGSPSLPHILSNNKKLLSADAVLSADGARWRADLPALNVGSRGNGGLGFTVTTAAKDLHSGRFGGAVPNALHVISSIAASLHCNDGSVAVSGFYDDVQLPASAERNAMNALPFNGAQWAESLSTQTTGEAGWSTLERLWVRPTIELNGLWGGYQGAGAKTVIPHQASAKLTTRLVTGQDPEKVRRSIENHLTQHCPSYATIKFEEQHGWVGAYSVPRFHPLLLAAERALLATTGKTPVRVRIGATLPLTEVIHQALGLDTIMFSFSTADEDFHAPNEFLRLSAIDEGLAAWVQILREVASDYR
ncbi:MAG: dipeptidase [Granulosicoccus sp.]